MPISPLVVLGCCCMGAGEDAGELRGKGVVVTEHYQELCLGGGKRDMAAAAS